MPPSHRADAPASHGSCCAANPTIGRPRADHIGAPTIAGGRYSHPRRPPVPRNGGCTFAENPALPAAQANILWTAALDLDVLPVVAYPARANEVGFDLADWSGRAAIVTSDDREHVTLRHGGGLLRVDVAAGTLLEGPVMLAHCVTDPADLEAKLPVLRTLYAVCTSGPNTVRYVPDLRLERLITALRVLDARVAGASLRDIAIALLGDDVPDKWPGDGECMKSWVRRLVALSETLRRAGPRGVLAGAI